MSEKVRSIRGIAAVVAICCLISEMIKFTKARAEVAVICCAILKAIKSIKGIVVAVATYFLIPQRDLALNNWPPFYLRLN
jgi:Ni,Fe-hydrogenase I cytochrome b subunit